MSVPSTPLILIAEDHADTRELYAAVCHAAGWRCDESVDGYLALSKARALQPAVIVLDLRLPRRDGWEVLRVLKSESVIREIPTIVVTADALPSHHRLLMDAGAAAVLVKPCLPDALHQTIEQLLTIASQ